MRDARVRFAPTSAFTHDLRSEVDRYFAAAGRSMHGGPALWVKTALLLAATAAAALLFALGGGSLPEAMLWGALTGLGMAGLGFAVQHDGGHGAYASKPFWNRMTAGVLDLLGGSSYFWRWKHNVLHHTYPNLVGIDDDIDVGMVARLAPGQRRRAFHRWQHLYVWPLYGLLTLKWTWADDFIALARGAIGSHAVPRPSGRDWVLFLGGKALTVGWTLVLPVVAHGWGPGLAYYVTLHLVLGLLLSVVFQLAHCVEEAEFPAVPTAPEDTADWALHQLRTTVDFSRRNPLATWYFGGLNYQAVHHLFPRVSHVHYPAMSRILEAVAARHGVRYRTNPSFPRAVRSHYRWLKRMGAAVPAAAS